jgi:hypothetical protein
LTRDFFAVPQFQQMENLDTQSMLLTIPKRQNALKLTQLLFSATKPF